MHVKYDLLNNVIRAIEGVTPQAELSLPVFTSNKDETFDEAMLRALKSMQQQLKASGISDPMIDNTIAATIPMLAVFIRKDKKKTASYREFTFPH